jgi:hypothetical protein
VKIGHPETFQKEQQIQKRRIYKFF